MVCNSTTWSLVFCTATILVLVLPSYIAKLLSQQLLFHSLELSYVGRSQTGDVTLDSGLLQQSKRVRVVCMSDSHGNHRQVEVPEGDILIFTGDATNPHNNNASVSNWQQLEAFKAWFLQLPHPHKIVVAGNHDAELGTSLAELRELFSEKDTTSDKHEPSLVYLQDETVHLTVRRGQSSVQVNVFGTPWQPQFSGFETFENDSVILEQRFSGSKKLVNMEVQNQPVFSILASHSPPFGKYDNYYGKQIGSEQLLEAVNYLKVHLNSPLLHCFGHIHNGRTEEVELMNSLEAPSLTPPNDTAKAKNQDPLSINAALVNDALELIWRPVVIDYIIP